jgi:hypothetical protein
VRDFLVDARLRRCGLGPKQLVRISCKLISNNHGVRAAGRHPSSIIIPPHSSRISCRCSLLIILLGEILYPLQSFIWKPLDFCDRWCSHATNTPSQRAHFANGANTGLTSQSYPAAKFGVRCWNLCTSSSCPPYPWPESFALCLSWWASTS